MDNQETVLINFIRQVYRPCIKPHVKHKFPIVAVIGSTKFKEEYLKVNKMLAKFGCVVLTCHLFGHNGDNEIVFTNDVKKMLDQVHFQMLEMCDFVYLINKDKYIGLSTCDELLYAVALDKPIITYEVDQDLTEGILNLRGTQNVY